MKIELNNISKASDKHLVLNKINLIFQGGRVYGLKGKNGSGKTMLLRMIAGLILPDEGTVTINDNILGKEISFPPNLGILIENPGFIPEYSGKDNLRDIASIKKICTDNEIDEIMNFYELDPESTKKVKKYSLGMKQKLGLCMAFMEKPDIILLDEPLNALDEKAIQNFMEMVGMAKERGAIIIIASHDKEELEVLADEMIELRNGEVIHKDEVFI